MNEWIKAFRLRTLPLSLSTIIVGNALALKKGFNNPLIFAFALITTVFLQILSNLANDYGDFTNGADNDDRVGPQRALQSGAITVQSMKKAILLFSALSFISGLVLLYIAFGTKNMVFVLLFLVLGLSSIWAALNYTAGKNPYGYRAFGDLFVFIFFGLVGVFGCYFLQTKSFDLDVLLPAIAIGLFSTGVLNINNIRDIESDEKSGKITIPVLIGKTKAKIYHAVLLGFGMAFMLLWTKMNYQSPMNFVYVLVFVLFVKNTYDVATINDAHKLNSKLRDLALSIFAMSVLFYCFVNVY